jgi:hypothetical protein
VKLLLSAGADPNSYASEENLTPLHDAASHGHAEVVRLLVAAGADSQARTSQGRSARDLATGDEIIAALDTAVAVRLETTMARAADRDSHCPTPGDLEAVVVAWPDASVEDWKKVMAGLGRFGGGKPNRQVGPATTHCLVGKGQSDHQLALLLSAQLVGCHLVKIDWLWQSLEAGHPVDTQQFKVQ